MILYLCDGKQCGGCTHTNDCKHTTNVKHAVNFKDDGYGNMVEQPALLEAKDSFVDLVKAFNGLLDKYVQVRAIRLPMVRTFEEQQTRLDEVCKEIEFAISFITQKIKEANNGRE